MNKQIALGYGVAALVLLAITFVMFGVTAGDEGEYDDAIYVGITLMMGAAIITIVAVFAWKDEGEGMQDELQQELAVIKAAISVLTIALQWTEDEVRENPDKARRILLAMGMDDDTVDDVIDFVNSQGIAPTVDAENDQDDEG